MAKKADKKKIRENEVNEPQASYEPAKIGGKIHFFSSLEEMEADNYKYWISLTPEQRLSIVCEMRSRMWKNEKRTDAPLGNRIYFDE